MQQGRMIEAEPSTNKASTMASKFTGNAKRKRNFEIRARSGRAASLSGGRIGTPPSPISRRY